MDRRGRLYQQVANQLREGLDARRFRDKLPTEHALVEQFQVSLTTVKKALSVLVDEGRIVRISGKGTFPLEGQSPLEPSRQEASSGLVGFLIPVLPDEFSRRLLKGVSDGLAESGLHPVLGLTGPDTDNESRLIRRMRSLGVDGLIICPMEGELYNEEILRMKLERFPFVLIDRRLAGIETPYIVGDGRGLIEAAVRHLMEELGHQHIALLATTPGAECTQSLAVRIEGFEDAVAQYGSAPPTVWTIQEDARRKRDPFIVVRDYVDQTPNVTAVIGATTGDTLLIYRVAKALALRIPEDLSVVGFDYSGIVDVQAVAEGEGLTWLDQSEEQMGRKAAELIRAVIEDPNAAPYAVIPGVFRPGASTAKRRPVAQSAFLGERP